MKRLKFSHDNLSIECAAREYQQVQEFKRLDFCSVIEKLFTNVLVYEVRWRLKVEKKYFNIDENISSEQIYALLDNIDNDNEEEIDNLINDSDSEFIADEEILPANNTLDTLLTTLEANIHVVKDNEESKKPDKKKKEPWKWTRKAKANKQEPCALIPEIQAELKEIVSPIEIFELVTGLEELIDLIVARTNNADNNELKAFLGINYIMAISKLPTIAEYWRADKLIGNNVIQNTMIRNCFCEILQNLHFTDNTYDDKIDRGFKVRPVIDHLNKKFAEVLSNANEQSTDEYMVKFKGCSGMKQYIKSKPIKWGFKFGLGALLKLGICTKWTFT